MDAARCGALMLAFMATLTALRVTLADFAGDLTSVSIGSPATAIFELQADGDIITQTNIGGTIDRGEWVKPKQTTGSLFEVRLTVNSGSVSIGTTGSWLSLSSSHGWTQSRSAVGVQTANVTLEIRKASSGTVLASKTFTFEAERA